MPARRLVLGLGNDLLGDDSIGLRVVDSLRRRPSLTGFHFETADCAGLALLDLLAGYDRAFVIDCVECGRKAAGTVRRLRYDEMEDPLTLSSHYAGLPDVLALGRRLGLPLPQVEVLAIGVKDPYRISEELSAGLRRSLPAIVGRVEQALLECERA